MIGVRCGVASGLSTGLAGGSGADPLGGGGRQIIAIVGQSNAVGFTDIDTVTNSGLWSPAYPRVQAKEQQGTNANPPVWTFYPTRALQPKPEHATLNMGIELSLGRYLDARRPSGFSIVKFGLGDTGLNDHWLNPAYPVGGPSLLDQMIAFLRASESELGGRIAAFIWIQGERDATDATDAAAYETNLTTLISDLRAIWPDLPFLYNRLHTSNPGAQKAVIRTAQTNVDANVAGTTMVNCDDLALQGDNLHFTGDGYITLGNRFGTATLAALGINTLLPGFTTMKVGLQVNVTDTSSDDDGAVAAWQYNWGDGTAASTAQNPSHAYAAEGTYTITQRVTDNSGATAGITAQVAVSEPRWAVDATSGKGWPISAAEWSDFISDIGQTFSAPDHMWLFQELSGTLADSIDARDLTVAGSPLYAQTVTGWATKAVTASGLAANQTANNTTFGNANANSLLLLMYAEIAQPVLTHTRAFLGAASGNDFQGLAASNAMRLRTGANIANGTLSHVGQVRPYVLRWDRSGAGANVLYSDIEKVSVTFASFSGTELRFTFGTAADVTANTKVLRAAAWEGTSAELTEAEIKAMLQGLNWSISGW